MDTNERMVVAVPAVMREIGNKIWKVLDSDIGGELSFDYLVAIDADGAEFAVCDTPASDTLLKLWGELNQDSVVMRFALSREYEARYPDDAAPLTVECEAFTTFAKVIIEPVGRQLHEVLAEMGMALVFLGTDSLPSDSTGG